MPISVPMPTKNPGDVLTSTLWNSYLRDNLNKLLNQGHRVLTVAQFAALTGIEDGDEVYLEVDAANGIIWSLRYVAAEPTYKWRCFGGSPLVSLITADETTISGAYSALATPGPSLALPRSGDYDVVIETNYANSSSGVASRMSYDIGGTGAVDADAVSCTSAFASLGRFTTVRRKQRKAGLTSVTLTAKYTGDGSNTSGFQYRSMELAPVRLI